MDISLGHHRTSSGSYQCDICANKSTDVEQAESHLRVVHASARRPMLLQSGEFLAASLIKDSDKMPKLGTDFKVIHSGKDSTYVCFDLVHRHTLKKTLSESEFKNLSPRPDDIELLPVSVSEAVSLLNKWGFKQDSSLRLDPKKNSIVMYVAENDHDDPTHFIVSTDHDTWLSKNGLYELIEIKRPQQLEGRFGKPTLSFTLGN